jgi:hypothetical protein
MIDKDELCQKIRDIYPDIGECGIQSTRPTVCQSEH